MVVRRHYIAKSCKRGDLKGLVELLPLLLLTNLAEFGERESRDDLIGKFVYSKPLSERSDQELELVQYCNREKG